MKNKINSLFTSRNIIDIIILVSIAYLLFIVVFEKPIDTSILDSKLEEIDKSTKKLEAAQLKYDSLIKEQENKISDIDYKIDNIKEKTTIVREYYHEISKKADNYNSSQIDSFFKIRYNY